MTTVLPPTTTPAATPAITPAATPAITPAATPAPAGTVTVVIADEHRLYGTALELVLRSAGDLSVVGQVNSGSQLRRHVLTRPPHVAVVDTLLPELEVAVAALRAANPPVALLLLTGRGSSAQLTQAAAWGAQGYLRKSAAAADLLAGIRTVAAGHQCFDPTLLADAMTAPVGPPRPSARELSTLRLVAAGLSNNDIARTLSLSPGTVRNYVSAVIAKTNARNRVDAIRIAREYAWI